MPGTAIGKSLNLGFAGKISRNNDNIVRSRFVKSILDGNGNETLPTIYFGDPAVLNSDNSYSRFGATGAGVAAPTAANFAGFAVAEVKQVFTYSVGVNNTTGGYTGAQPADVLKRGTITVFCKEGAPVAGGPVYVVTVAATTGALSAVGDIIANSVPAGTGAPATVQLTNCQFTTGKIDANKIAEVTILDMVNP